MYLDMVDNNQKIKMKYIDVIIDLVRFCESYRFPGKRYHKISLNINTHFWIS